MLGASAGKAAYVIHLAKLDALAAAEFLDTKSSKYNDATGRKRYSDVCLRFAMGSPDGGLGVVVHSHN